MAQPDRRMSFAERADRLAMPLLVAIGLLLAARGWLGDHPQHDPWAPLDLADPPGWATKAKLAALRDDTANCRTVLERSGIAFTALPPTGAGECARPDRTVLSGALLAPAKPQMTCPVAAGLELWLRQGVQPAALAQFGSRVTRIEHLGTYNCRRINGGESGNWSEHASGNAIDIAGFVLADGRRISVRKDWRDEDKKAAFLHSARDAACEAFGTVLSPDYNSAHADHLHLDQAARGLGSYCR